MSTLSSDELAEDYKSSLEDLSFNSRYEISNLTVIARENVAAAQAIARTLETHIQNVGCSLKLLDRRNKSSPISARYKAES
jgi:pre-mRNA cleavage complex 2 protein Pcf11